MTRIIRDIGVDAEVVTVVITKAEAVRAIRQMVCDNTNFDGRAWSMSDAEAMEAAARRIRESLQPEYHENARRSISLADLAGDLRTVAELERRFAALAAAVQTHRRNVWGDDPVQHPDDVALYLALEAK